MLINIPTLSAQINPEHLSGGEQVFVQQLQRKSENGQILRPGERCFIRDMEIRSSRTTQSKCYV